MTYDYWDNYEPFDEATEALKATLRDSVKQEVAARIETLEAENGALRKTLENLSALELGAKSAKLRYEQEFRDARQTALREVRKEKLGELLRVLDERLYTVEREYKERPKCDVCNEERQLVYLTPRGREMKERCECAEQDSHWVAVETAAHEVTLNRNNGKLHVWWLAVRRWGEDDEICHRALRPSSGASHGDMLASPRDYSFKTLDEAQDFADNLNALESKEPTGDF